MTNKEDMMPNGEEKDSPPGTPNPALQLKTPVNKASESTFARWCKEENCVIAGYIPDDVEEPDALQICGVTFNDELDSKYQDVWNAYLKNPNADVPVKAMKLYDVKTFKAKLVLLAGYPEQIEKAQKDIEPHPQMYVFPDDVQREKTLDNIKENPLKGSPTEAPLSQKPDLRKNDNIKLKDKESAGETTDPNDDGQPPTKKWAPSQPNTEQPDPQDHGKYS